MKPWSRALLLLLLALPLATRSSRVSPSAGLRRSKTRASLDGDS